VEQGVTITPAMVDLNRSSESDWARAVLSFVEHAARQGRSVNLSVIDQSYSPTEVARMCDVSRATVHRRIADGTISANRRGSRWRVPESAIDEYRSFLMDQAAAALANDF
jgi:excisionase family DNA binding protein